MESSSRIRLLFLDREGVGQLVKMATERGRKTRPDLKVGICGEHGGEPSSVEFCYKTGLKLRFLFAIPRTHRAASRGPGRSRRKAAERRWKNKISSIGHRHQAHPGFDAFFFLPGRQSSLRTFTVFSAGG